MRPNDPPNDRAEEARTDEGRGHGARGEWTRYRRARRFGPRGPRPPWWPEDEAWPPHRSPALRLLRGAGCVLVILGIMLAAGMLAGGFAYRGHFMVIRVLLLVAGGIAVVSALAGGIGVRRIAGPLSDLLAASRRVEAGDFTARVRERVLGPRLLRELLGTFNTMASRLEADEERRRQLLADVGHELRTPIAILQGGIEAMIDGVHPADEAHLAVLLDETRHLGRLVDDLRTVTLADAGTLALHREPTDLGILVAEVAEAFQPQAQAASVTVRAEVADDVPLLDVDPVRVREVLENLLANALRYAPAGSAIRLEARVAAGPRSGGVEFLIADQGPGIDPALLPRIFDRFVKSDGSPGSGLGLAIARGIVEAHGGHIVAESDATGTRIRFELPSNADASA